MFKMFLIILALTAPAQRHPANIYSAWTDNGVRLIISDAGTPGNYDDDFIIDLENNRDFEIKIND